METVLGRRRRRERPSASRGLKLAIAGVALLVLAVIGVIAGRGGGDSNDARTASSAAALPASSAAAPAESEVAAGTTAAAMEAAAPTAAADTAAAEAVIPPAAGARDLPVAPRIAQTGAITVRVPVGSLDAKIDQIGVWAEQVNGYVAGTEADLSGQAGRGQATVTVRVPQERYARTVQRFATLGTVVGRQSSSDDLTQDYVDTGSRLRHARLVEARLVALLDEAKTVNETLAIQSRLDDVQLRIETDRGRLDNLTRVTSYATIAVNLVTAGPAPAVAVVAKKSDDRPWGLRDAADDALHNVADTAAAMTRGLGVVLPLLVLAAGVWIVWRIARRLTRRAPEPPPAT